jgi:thiamine pyrophosphate-dependent acetolactate synthase large subunit-like protein
MKDLVQQYVNREIDRQTFLSRLAACGVSAASALGMAQSLAAFQPRPAGAAEPEPAWMREMSGTGAELLLAQLKEAGVKYVFFNPSTTQAALFDALVDDPTVAPIKALQEGSLTAMADGYAKASGKTPFVMCARPGFPNAMTQMFNSWKDQIPVIVAVDGLPLNAAGQDGSEDADHMESMPQTITKWYWVVESAGLIPETTRRAMKFASTAPCGPVFLTFPADTLQNRTTSTIMRQSMFEVSTRVRPDAALIEQTARLLLDAQNPMIYVGDEVTRCGAQPDVVELAELLGTPVTKEGGGITGWSYPFPTRHPLWMGGYLRTTRFPAQPDVLLNLGGRLPWGEKIDPRTKLIQVRLDPSNIARTAATEIGMIGDLQLTTRDLIAAVRSQATASRLQQTAADRAGKVKAYTTRMHAFRESIARANWNNAPISWSRLAIELEGFLDKDAAYVTDTDSGKLVEDFLAFGGSDKMYVATSGAALGWALPAAFGVKLGAPDRQVVAIVGDGSFLFSGPQPLWSFARYRAPVTIIVCNNRSYNGERTRQLGRGGRQFDTGRDMACYLGSPDIDFAKTSMAFGVQAEVVGDPAKLRPALERAKRVTVAGEPYLLDVHIERDGAGAASTWYPEFSIAALRQKQV